MLSSLELRWLKPPKDLSLPLIVVDGSDGFWGVCYAPQRGELLIGNRYWPLDKGILHIDVTTPMDPVALLVHEFRHHWQNKNGWVYDGIGDTTHIGIKLRSQGVVFPATEASCEYYVQSRSEYDAFCYQHKYRPERYSIFLEDWFRKRKEHWRRSLWFSAFKNTIGGHQ
jgi:hypothetical protein